MSYPDADKWKEATLAELADWFSALASAAKEGTKPATLARRLAEATFRLGAPIL